MRWSRCWIGIVVAWLALWPGLGLAQSSTSFTFHAGATAVANGAVLSAANFSTIIVQVEGTFVGTVQFQKKTKSGSAYVAVQCTDANDRTMVSTTADSPGYWECPGAAYSFRAAVTAYTSGTIVVTGMGSTAVTSRGGTGTGGGASTLTQAYQGGKDIVGPNSLATAVCIGVTLKLCTYEDATLGPLSRPSTDSNTRTYIWNGFTWCLYDIEASICVLTVDPDATDNDKYVWAAGYRPIKTLPLTADALYTQGAAALVTDTALISGGLVSPYLTITDSNSDGFHRFVVMDPKWDGGTVTATLTVVNTNATPANAFEVDVSGQCYPAGTVIGTTISTTGEQPATITFGASGACGVSACHQNDPASATTPAITLNGTPAGGNVCGFQAQVDATATTEAVAGIKVVQLDIHYKIAKGF